MISRIAVSPDGELLLAATLEDGVFLSDDGGLRWTAWNFGLFDRCVLDVALSNAFMTDQSALAITGTGCFISHNAGRTWQDIPLPSGIIDLTTLCATGDGWLVATANGNLHRVDPGGTLETTTACALAEEPVALLTAHDAETIAVTVSGRSVALDATCAPSPINTRNERHDIPVTCATLQGSSLVLGWSDGCMTTTDLSNRQGSRPA